MSNPLPPWTTRNSFQKEPHQRVVDRVNELHNITPPAGGEVLRTPFGTGVNTPRILLLPNTYGVVITGSATGADLPAHLGGYCDGYAFKKYVNSIPPPGGIPCRIIVDEQVNSVSGASGTSEWGALGGYGIGVFEGEYTAETTPRMVIHATGFSPSLYNLGVIVPFRDSQQWNRDSPYVDPTNVANDLIGNVAPTLVIRMANGKSRTLEFDASGRIWNVSAGT